jgi:hypothetical protein
MKKKKKKYKSIITRRIFKSIDKIGICVLVASFFAGIVVMRGTNAGFLDEEKTSSKMDMGVLDAGIVYAETFNVNGLIPGVDPAPFKGATFSNTGSLNFKYEVKYLKTGGDQELCDKLLLTAKKGVTTVYDKKSLKDFNLKNAGGTDFSILVSEKDDWNFTVELPADAGKTLENKTCKFNFDFTAWQVANNDGSKGFTAKETFGENNVQTGEWENYGDVVINEIMWMGNDDGSSDNDEWLELRNMTDKSIDISGWSILNAGHGSGEDAHIQIPNGYSIKSNGYFLIIKEKWDNTKINLAEDLDKNEGMTNIPSMSLSQGGETLTLQNKNKITIDTAWKGSAWPAGTNSTLSQSMERNNESQGGPGDGTLADSWHTCASELCKGIAYWDTLNVNNYGTPGAANLSPVVMNEISANPDADDNQWVELYNLLDKDFDVSGWYFKNNNGDKIIISKGNTNSGKTTVSGKGMLVVNLGKNFLNNNSDIISFYDDMGTSDDKDDDIREDVFGYKDTTKNQGDSFMRFPDGVGIWIDPQATPGEENKLLDKELDGFRLLTYGKCFNEEGNLEKNSKEEICAPVFLEYINMIKELDDKKIKNSTLMDILEMKKEEEKKKLDKILKETEKMLGEQNILTGDKIPPVIPDSAKENYDSEEPISADKVGAEIVGDDSVKNDSSGDADKKDILKTETEIETKKEEPDNMITNETNEQI